MNSRNHQAQFRKRHLNVSSFLALLRIYMSSGIKTRSFAIQAPISLTTIKFLLHHISYLFLHRYDELSALPVPELVLLQGILSLAE